MKRRIFAVLATFILMFTLSGMSPAVAAPSAGSGVSVTAGASSWAKWYWCNVHNQFCDYKRVCYIVQTPTDSHLFGRYICTKVKV